MLFNEALDVLEKDLRKFLGFKLPKISGSGLQFRNIATEFFENCCTTAQGEPKPLPTTNVKSSADATAKQIFPNCEKPAMELKSVVYTHECNNCGFKV